MEEDTDKVDKTTARHAGASFFLLAVGACVTLLFSGCFESHVQETVTVAPRATVTPAQAATAATPVPPLPRLIPRPRLRETPWHTPSLP